MPRLGVLRGFVMLRRGNKCQRSVWKKQSVNSTGLSVHRIAMVRCTICARLWITLIECSAQEQFLVEIPGMRLSGNPSRIVPMASSAYSVRMM
jgi:hypothetical protein